MSPQHAKARSNVLRLPELDDRQIPGWRFTRHAVRMMLAAFFTLILLALVAASLITMNVTVDADGMLEPVAVWPVRSLENGILVAIQVRTGDTVRAGQPIARLDSTASWGSVTELDGQVRAAKIELEGLVLHMPLDADEARAGVAQAQAHVNRARAALRQRMADFGIAGNADSVALASGARIHVGLDAASAELNASEGELASMQTRLSSTRLARLDIEKKRAEIKRLQAMEATSRTHLTRQVILAPATGVVLTEQIDQLLGSSVAAGQSFLEIADQGQWRANLAVSESDVYRLRPGDVADVEIPAFASMPVNRFRGRVEAIGSQLAAPGGPSSGAGTPGYRVIVRLSQDELRMLPPGALRRGYGVHGKLVTNSASPLTLLIEYVRDRARGISR